MWNRIALCILSASLAVLVSCGAKELPLKGQVLVDGAPLDSGTLRLDPVDGSAGKGTGGGVEEGVLQLPVGHGLRPGKYRVSVTGFKRTGRKINDPQRGEVDEMVPLAITNSPQEIEIATNSASNLTIEFFTSSRR